MVEKRENPVSDVVRDGRREIVLSANITVEGWTFGAVRINGHHDFKSIAYHNSDHYVEPPPHIKAEAHRIAGKLFSEVRTIGPRVRPTQGVLML